MFSRKYQISSESSRYFGALPYVSKTTRVKSLGKPRDAVVGHPYSMYRLVLHRKYQEVPGFER